MTHHIHRGAFFGTSGRGARPVATPGEVINALKAGRATIGLPEGEKLRVEDLVGAASRACASIPVEYYGNFIRDRLTADDRRLLGLPPKQKRTSGSY